MAGDVFYYGDCHFSHDDNVDELKSVALEHFHEDFWGNIDP